MWGDVGEEEGAGFGDFRIFEGWGHWVVCVMWWMNGWARWNAWGGEKMTKGKLGK